MIINFYFVWFLSQTDSRAITMALVGNIVLILRCSPLNGVHTFRIPYYIEDSWRQGFAVRQYLRRFTLPCCIVFGLITRPVIVFRYDGRFLRLYQPPHFIFNSGNRGRRYFHVFVYNCLSHGKGFILAVGGFV